MKKQSNKKSDSPKSTLSKTAASDSALYERIARKAYELYEKQGSVHGLDVQDWFEAERLVLAETKAGTKTETVAKAKTQLQGKAKPTQPGSAPRIS